MTPEQNVGRIKHKGFEGIFFSYDESYTRIYWKGTHKSGWVGNKNADFKYLWSQIDEIVKYLWAR